MLQFTASISVCPSDIQKMKNRLKIAGTSTKPLESVLMTPLFVSPDSLKAAKKMAEDGAEVYFDSAGYHVQIGKIRYEDLYLPLLDIYRANQWASRFTLPDHVPLSSDSPLTVAEKVRDTITYSSLFFHELPDDMKERAMPVVHGRTRQQVDQCLSAYLGLGVKWIGFGSFGTMGASSQMNIATKSAVELAKYVIDIAHDHGIKVHLFGLGAPPLVAMIKGVGADSFDSASWLVAAGYGMVSLPFWRFYNITYRSAKAELQRAVTYEQFEEWRGITGHSCKFCDDLEELRSSKMARAVHNLICLCESVEMVNGEEWDRVQTIYESASPKYRQEFNKWLAKD